MMHDELLDGTETRDRTMAAWLAYGKATAPRTRIRVDWKEVACNVAILAIIAAFTLFTFGM